MTMHSWPRAVLFDFDGVIVNSEPLHFLAFHDALAEQGIELTEAEYYNELLGFNDRDAIRHVFARREKPLSAKTALLVQVRKSRLMMNFIEQRRFHALPGVEAFVRGLWRNYPLAICSGALRDEIDAMLFGISLRDCFETIVAAEDVSAGKPDPSGYLLAMKLLAERHHVKLTPADCLIVEDAPTVVNATRAAGFRVLALTTSAPADRFSTADYVLDSLRPDEVLAKIPSLKISP
jgi:beta-phosphoglucomutase